MSTAIRVHISPNADLESINHMIHSLEAEGIRSVLSRGSWTLLDCQSNHSLPNMARLLTPWLSCRVAVAWYVLPAPRQPGAEIRLQN